MGMEEGELRDEDSIDFGKSWSSSRSY